MISASGSVEVRQGVNNSDRLETARHGCACFPHSFERIVTGLIKRLQFWLPHDNSLFAVPLHSLSRTDNVRCYLSSRAHAPYISISSFPELFSPHTKSLAPKAYLGGWGWGVHRWLKQKCCSAVRAIFQTLLQHLIGMWGEKINSVMNIFFRAVFEILQQLVYQIPHLDLGKQILMMLSCSAVCLWFLS